MKAMDETDDKIMTVMLKNDQTLTKVSGQRIRRRKLTFIFYDQNNETILSFNAMDI